MKGYENVQPLKSIGGGTGGFFEIRCRICNDLIVYVEANCKINYGIHKKSPFHFCYNCVAKEPNKVTAIISEVLDNDK